MPDFDLMFRGMNTDYNATNGNQTYGRDLDFGKTIIFEFGMRHAFSRDMVLDVSAYNKDKLSDVSVRLLPLPDPAHSSSTPGSYTSTNFLVATNADFGNVRGVDIRLDRRFSNLFSGAVSYTFQVAKNTGSDPFSYTTLAGRAINAFTGQTTLPAEAIQATDDNRTHNISGSASLQFPDDWKKGTMIGSVLRNLGAFATFRIASGLPYTLLKPLNQGYTLDSRCGLSCSFADPSGPLNTSTLPWFKNMDLRITKGMRLGRSEWTLFAEGTNIFDFKNVIDAFLETGGIVYGKFQQTVVGEQKANLANEAQRAGILLADSTVDFTRLGGCGNWQGQNSSPDFSSGPVDCVLLERAEARYGNGDGKFTLPEYTAAFTAYYNLQNAQSRFYGPGRRIRIGAQLSF